MNTPNDTVVLQARRYSSDLLGDRVVVRLVPENLVEVEDLSLEVVGLSPDGGTAVGHVQNRAIGFPAWAIIHDPANARHALNLVQGLQRAARQAASKPGAARDRILDLADLLGRSAPHFLPTFLEEGARIFIETENLQQAKQLFGKAREAERVHGLTIDQERHRAVLLEFALAGALSAKELSAALEHFEPQDALEAFVQLTVDRVRGGGPPSATTASELRRLAKKAGAKPTELAPEVLLRLIDEPAVKQAPIGFWQGFGATLTTLAKGEAHVRDVLFSITDIGSDTDRWVEILEATGVADEMRRGERDVASWITGVIRAMAWSYGRNSVRKLSALVRQCGGLREATVDLTTMAYYRLSPELIDALLEPDARVLLSGHTRIQLDEWLEEEDKAPLDFLSEDPEVRKLVDLGNLISDGVPPELLRHSGTRKLLQYWSVPQLDDDATFLQIQNEYARLWPLTQLTDRSLVADGLAAFRNHLDAPELLAAALREGLLIELTWPTLEQAAEELRASVGGEQITTHEAWPAVGVAAAGEVRFVDGEDVVAEARFTPTGGTEPHNWNYTLVSGVVGCLWRDDDWTSHLTWSNDPTVHHELRGYYGRYGTTEASIPVGDGRLCGRDVQRVGDAEAHFVSPANTLSDGETYWSVGGFTDDGPPFAEVDPTTGRLGRRSLPTRLADLVEPYLRDGARLLLRGTFMRPTTPTTAQSRMVVRDGLHGWIVLNQPGAGTTFLDLNGEVSRSQGAPFAGRIARPGGGHWLIGSDGDLYTSDGRSVLPRAAGADRRLHLLHTVPVVGWHQFQARDEQVSARMRQLQAADVTALLEISQASREFALPDDDATGEQLTPETLSAARSLLGTEDETLAAGVAWLAAQVKHLVEAAEQALSSTHEVQDATFAEFTPRADLLAWWNGYGRSEEIGRRSVLQLGEALRQGGPSEQISTDAAVVAAATRPDVLLALATAPLLEPAILQGTAALFGAVVDAGLATGTSACSMFEWQPPRYDKRIPPGTVYTLDEGPGVLVHVGWIGPGNASYRDNWRHYVIWPSGCIASHIDDIPCEAVTGSIVGTDIDALRESFEHLLEHGAPEWSPAWAEQLAEGTGWSRAAAAVFLTGMQRTMVWEKNYLPKPLRELLGLKVADAEAARQFLRNQDPMVLLDMYSAAALDPRRLVTDGPDIATMIEVWNSVAGDRTSVSEELLAEADKAFQYAGAQKLQAVADGEGSLESSASVLFWLAGQIELADDTSRAWVADQMEALAERMRGEKWEFSYVDANQRKRYGFPKRPEDGGDVHTIGPWTVRGGRYSDEWELDGTKVTDWYAVVAQMVESEFWGREPLQRALPLLEGEIQPLLDWLRTPGEGYGQDPLVSAPETVATVAAELGVPEASARYWLQVLALHHPTDSNIDMWNGWKKKDRDAAAQPLLEKGLLVQAKRARARRSYFLPGGWQEASAPHLPMEVWKAPFYVLKNSVRVSPVHEAVVSLIPPGDLFETAWERYLSGDTPGYEELRTEPYRRR